ncbi:SERTA domain-containing protein 2 [Microcaecilia unicolor]|uniref:SERTA domain-containing protein 2-like n=1 Tax=Microcaecilia unicolor TaxID=1415580 RepID=A0A6P7ZN22_9AMPH|nr:SERTA domain-containing protein 2-like [Microcaecilia unicolor]
MGNLAVLFNLFLPSWMRPHIFCQQQSEPNPLAAAMPPDPLLHCACWKEDCAWKGRGAESSRLGARGREAAEIPKNKILSRASSLKVLMQPRGVKRKLYVGEDDPASSEADGYSHLRQSLLDLSLNKFHQGRRLAEPNLRRCVLVTNTLRMIQEDIQQTSNPSPPSDLLLVGASLPAAASPTQAARLALENQSTTSHDDLDNMLFSPEDDFSLSASISSILRELDVVLDEGSSPSAPADSLHQDENQETEAKQELAFDTCDLQKSLPDSSDSQGCLPVKELSLQADFSQNAVLSLQADFSHNTVEDPTGIVESKDIDLINQFLIDVNDLHGLGGDTEKKELQQESVSAQQASEREMPTTPFLGSFEVLSSSYLSDFSIDDLFPDIDTSVFERDSSMLGTATSSWPSSCTADGPQAYSSSCNWMPFASNQSGRDLNELDNIVEILVGT